MNLVDRLKRFDTNGSVAQEFRVYTVQGAVFSVLTLVSILYLVTTEAYFNFQIDVQQLLHVNATSPVGVPMEFDITIHSVRCSDLSIDAQDPAGQSQSMHLDRNHHVWKHRVRRPDDTNSRGPWQLIGSPKQLELGSTLLDLQDVYRKIDRNMQIMGLAEGGTTEPCGSCYGAGEPGECCNTCDDVKRAYKLKGWGLANQAEVLQCQEEAKAAAEEQEGEGCNVHGIVALDSGGGNLHLAPGEEMATGIPRTSASLFDLLLAQFHEWNVTHTINKIRFGPHYPGAKYQLDGQERVIADSHGMYQYYVQVRCGLLAMAIRQAFAIALLEFACACSMYPRCTA